LVQAPRSVRFPDRGDGEPVRGDYQPLAFRGDLASAAAARLAELISSGGRRISNRRRASRFILFSEKKVSGLYIAMYEQQSPALEIQQCVLGFGKAPTRTSSSSFVSAAVLLMRA
jgi:hypothetical protein